MDPVSCILYCATYNPDISSNLQIVEQQQGKMHFAVAAISFRAWLHFSNPFVYLNIAFSVIVLPYFLGLDTEAFLPGRLPLD